MNSYKKTLDSFGYAITNEKISQLLIQVIKEKIQNVSSHHNYPQSIRKKNNKIYAIRNLAQLAPEIIDILGKTCIKDIVKDVLGPNFFLVQSFLFDKIAEANFNVPFHQDITVSVAQRKEVHGYRNWKNIAGVPQVCPPLEVLESLVALRISLDTNDIGNGPLKVITKTHNMGILTPQQVKHCVSHEKQIVCTTEKGSILLMKPLLLHSSGRLVKSDHRRVIHLVYSNYNLPHGLNWLTATHKTILRKR